MKNCLLILLVLMASACAKDKDMTEAEESSKETKKLQKAQCDGKGTEASGLYLFEVASGEIACKDDGKELDVPAFDFFLQCEQSEDQFNCYQEEDEFSLKGCINQDGSFVITSETDLGVLSEFFYTIGSASKTEKLSAINVNSNGEGKLDYSHISSNDQGEKSGGCTVKMDLQVEKIISQDEIDKIRKELDVKADVGESESGKDSSDTSVDQGDRVLTTTRKRTDPLLGFDFQPVEVFIAELCEVNGDVLQSDQDIKDTFLSRACLSDWTARQLMEAEYGYFVVNGDQASLLEIHLDQSYLKALPQSITGFKQLRVLSVNDNTLTELPEGLKDLEDLRLLELASNPWTQETLDSLEPWIQKNPQLTIELE